jgi:hypothetical protein
MNAVGEPLNPYFNNKNPNPREEGKECAMHATLYIEL